MNNVCFAVYHDTKMTKLRFIKQSNFGIKNYIKDKEGVSLLKLKLNMTDMKANYKANHNNSLCRRCGTQEEKIEHLWDCPEFSNECTTKIVIWTKMMRKL